MTIFTVIFSTNPFITTILASFLFGTKVSRIEIAGMIVCFACVVLVISAKTGSDPSSETQMTSVLGPLLGMTLAFAPATAYSINGLLAYSMRPLHFTIQLFYVALCMVLVSSCIGLG